jgi:hypothetical protein
MYASRQYTVAAIAKTLGVSRAAIYRHLPAAVAGKAPRQGCEGAHPLSGDQGDRDLAVADLGGFLTVRDRSCPTGP